jgi:hypothetical protein
VRDLTGETTNEQTHGFAYILTLRRSANAPRRTTTAAGPVQTISNRQYTVNGQAAKAGKKDSAETRTKKNDAPAGFRGRGGED